MNIKIQIAATMSFNVSILYRRHIKTVKLSSRGMASVEFKDIHVCACTVYNAQLAHICHKTRQADLSLQFESS